jgi:hypothetical protein
MTLRVISIAGWTEKIITRIETRNRLWKDREGQNDESAANKTWDAGHLFGLRLGCSLFHDVRSGVGTSWLVAERQLLHHIRLNTASNSLRQTLLLPIPSSLNNSHL